MYLFTIYVALIVLPVLIVIFFVIPESLVKSSSSNIDFIGISLCKQQSFEFRNFRYSHLSVFVQKIKRLRTGLGVYIVSGSEVVM